MSSDPCKHANKHKVPHTYHTVIIINEYIIKSYIKRKLKDRAKMESRMCGILKK